MTAEVSVITAEVEDVIRVRNTALRARLPDNLIPDEPEDHEEGNGRAYMVQNGQLVTKSVRTGLNDGVYTEIISGLSEGDTLAVGLSLTSQDSNNNRSLLGGSQAQY